MDTSSIGQRLPRLPNIHESASVAKILPDLPGCSTIHENLPLFAGPEPAKGGRLRRSRPLAGLPSGRGSHPIWMLARRVPKDPVPSSPEAEAESKEEMSWPRT
jgi:hypothetical protein